jgi:D-alanine-D-alanine ligase-like ATP-grasp enzyme
MQVKCPQPDVIAIMVSKAFCYKTNGDIIRMSQRFAAIFLAAAAVLCAALLSAADAGAAVMSTSAVPGSAALRPGEIDSVSCSSAGHCVAGGYYVNSSGEQQAFVVTERNGAWGKLREVRGLASLGGSAGVVSSVSCASAGNCSAAGDDSSSSDSAFVVDEKHGSWARAERVPGLAALTGSGADELSSLSCTSAGNCTAYGTYDMVSTLESGLTHELAFVVSEKHGRWGTARAVPALAALNMGGMAAIESLSCGSAGNCSAGGFYDSFKGSGQAFIVTEKHGTWGRAEQVPGLSRLAQLADGTADVNSVSCGSPGNCSAGGYYDNVSGSVEGFVIGEKDGTWGRAEPVPGLARLNTGGGAAIQWLSCAAAGNCSAGGSYTGVKGSGQGFVVSAKDGTWGRAEPVRGLARLNTAGDANVSLLSCASAGNCSAVGSYANGHGTQAFVVSEKHGTWGRAEPVPGLVRLNTGGDANVYSLSCASAGNCSAGGSYSVGDLGYAFVVTEKHGTWGAATTVAKPGS